MKYVVTMEYIGHHEVEFEAEDKEHLDDYYGKYLDDGFEGQMEELQILHIKINAQRIY